jgi:hypothetical protein
VAVDLGSTGLLGRARLQGDLADAADGGQTFPPEAEGADVEEVVGRVELAVAWVAKARGRSSRSMPQPLSTTRM